MSTPQTRNRREHGFTLVELLIVMSVILILMTLAIPAMQSIIKTANEKSAINSLKFLNTEEANYASEYPQHGFSCSLPAMGGNPSAGTPTAEAAQLIPEDLAAGNKSGYTFTIVCGSKTTINNVDQVNSYTINATPNTVNKTGNRGYCTDENGAIHFDPKGGTNCTELLR
jgi:type IV pilus assembly protein PilA